MFFKGTTNYTLRKPKRKPPEKAVFFCAKRGDCDLLARRFPLAAAPWGLAC